MPGSEPRGARGSTRQAVTRKSQFACTLCTLRRALCSKHFASTLTNVLLAAASRILQSLPREAQGVSGRTRLHAQAGRLLPWQAASKVVPLSPYVLSPPFSCVRRRVTLASDPAPPSALAHRLPFRWAVERPGEIKGREEREVCVNSPDALPARSPRLAVTLEGKSQPLSGSPLH